MKNATLDTSKKILGPVHLLSKMDKCDYLWSPIIEKKMFLVLTSGKFQEALESGIGTCSVFCHSFSLSNNVALLLKQVFMAASKPRLSKLVHHQARHHLPCGLTEIYYMNIICNEKWGIQNWHKSISGIIQLWGKVQVVWTKRFTLRSLIYVHIQMRKIV